MFSLFLFFLFNFFFKDIYRVREWGCGEEVSRKAMHPRLVVLNLQLRLAIVIFCKTGLLTVAFDVHDDDGKLIFIRSGEIVFSFGLNYSLLWCVCGILSTVCNGLSPNEVHGYV